MANRFCPYCIDWDTELSCRNFICLLLKNENVLSKTENKKYLKRDSGTKKTIAFLIIRLYIQCFQKVNVSTENVYIHLARYSVLRLIFLCVTETINVSNYYVRIFLNKPLTMN